MKRYASIVIIVGFIFGGGYYAVNRTSTIEYVAPEVVVEEKVVKEDALMAEIKARQEAASDATEAIANKAAQDARDQENNKIELEVRKEHREQNDSVIIELEKKTGDFWRDQGNIVRLIKQTFPEEPQKAVAIAIAESELRPRALNAQDSHKGCKGSYGIFQIGCLHEKDPTILYDVEYNIKRARELYEQEGWKPWGAYTDGSYRQYLAQR